MTEITTFFRLWAPVWTILSGAWNRYSTRLTIKRITQPDDDVYAMCLLHRRLFPEELIADDFADLERWLEETPKRNNIDEILLVSKCKDDIISYVFAQYYKDSRYLFASYLGINKESLEDVRKIDAAFLLLQEILRILDKNGYRWKGIVGEMPEYRRRKEGRGYEPYAKEFAVLFRSIARKIDARINVKRRLARRVASGSNGVCLR